MKMKIGKLTKRCPRCNTKVPVAILTCPDCQLKYDKFEQATNKEAKQAIKQGNKDQVLMRTNRPSDVKFWKLFFMSLLFGFVGGHHYYVGRYKTGFFYTIFCIIGVTNAVLVTTMGAVFSGDLWEVFTFLVLIWGAVLALWIIDLAKICLNKFKIPVSISK